MSKRHSGSNSLWAQANQILCERHRDLLVHFEDGDQLPLLESCRAVAEFVTLWGDGRAERRL
jgi:hypothetical protein